MNNANPETAASVTRPSALPMGRAKPETTKRYDKRGEADKRQVVGLLNLNREK